MTDLIHMDRACTQCGTPPTFRTCDDCGTTGLITGCAHMDQPRPIDAGRCDGSDLHHTYCADCATEEG